MKTEGVKVGKQMRAEQRRYVHEKWIYMKKVLSKRKQYGIIEKIIQPEWVVVPFILPKSLLTNFWLMIELRGIKLAALTMTLPIPNSVSETSNTR